MAEDPTSLKGLHAELAALLGGVDQRIKRVESPQRLTPDEVRLKKLENAGKLGVTLARGEEFSSCARQQSLREHFIGRFATGRQLVDGAVAIARREIAA